MVKHKTRGCNTPTGARHCELGGNMGDKKPKKNEEFNFDRQNLISCEARYGKIRMGNSRHIDALDEMNSMPMGYKLLAA